jgi:NAD dependent epimerase/dehydratase family enzyme
MGYEPRSAQIRASASPPAVEPVKPAAALCSELMRTGHTVIVFSRNPVRAKSLVPSAASYVARSPDDLPEECIEHLGSADAVVYLTGGPLFDGRRHSRADVTAESRARERALGQLVGALGGLSDRSATLIAASSVGYYGYEGVSDAFVDETHSAGRDWWG